MSTFFHICFNSAFIHIRLHFLSFYYYVDGSKYECPNEGYQKDPEDCTKFYRCIDNGGSKLQAVHFDCAPGTVFSPDTSNCVHPRDANRPECPDISENLIDGGKYNNCIKI